MTMDPRKIHFDAARAADADGVLDLDDLNKIHAALDAAGAPRMDPATTVNRQIGPKGLDLIKHFEGCEKRLPDGRLTVYLDVAGIPTIGWGHTGKDVTSGLIITQAQADALLDKDLDRFEANVARLAGACTEPQFDALVSFDYNTGGLATSTLLKKHKAGDFEGAAREFRRWNKATVKGVKVVVNGLTRRRAAEEKLYRGLA